MTSADELIREAQYAFRNISHGSTDAKKYTAKAERYARQIIRKYPTSTEAGQARQILAQLNVQIPAPSQLAIPASNTAADFEKSHSVDAGHTTNAGHMPASMEAALQKNGVSEEWRNLTRRLMKVPPRTRRTIGVVVFLAIVFSFPVGIFLASGLVIYYAMRPALLKNHLDRLLTRLGSD